MDELILPQSIEYKPLNPITLKEHGSFCSNDEEYIRSLGVAFCYTPYEGTPKYLGICPHKLRASYYIGAEWLNDEQSIVVTPKDNRYDYIEMFMSALNCDLSSEYFSKFYSVNFNGKPIKTTAFSNLLTPLLIVHFIRVVKEIVQRGLKSDYVIKEENLQSKVKGKIKVTQNIKYNNINKRNDRVYCQYQEHTIDTAENRVLKRALILSKEYLVMIKDHKSYTKLSGRLNNLLASFVNVSDKVELVELKKVKVNKIYKNYTEALRVAKMILKRFNYSISETHTTIESTPPFWIDMSRLYEVYVYSKLLDVYGSDQIKFQVKGYRGSAVDFVKIDERIIIDTKYKPRYNDGNRGILDDVRQISAYARDQKILDSLGSEDVIPKCLIIYPEKVEVEEDWEYSEIDTCTQVEGFSKGLILDDAKIIRGFKEFYKLSIKLPAVSSVTIK